MQSMLVKDGWWELREHLEAVAAMTSRPAGRIGLSRTDKGHKI